MSAKKNFFLATTDIVLQSASLQSIQQADITKKGWLKLNKQHLNAEKTKANDLHGKQKHLDEYQCYK